MLPKAIGHFIHVTNEEVRRKIHASTGEYDELLILVKKRNSRTPGLAKTILLGTVTLKRRGRQKKRLKYILKSGVNRNGLWQLNWGS